MRVDVNQSPSLSRKLRPRALVVWLPCLRELSSIYALLVNINAYHQPGVEAGKKAAGIFLELLGEVKQQLSKESLNTETIAAAINADTEDVYHCLTHLSSNGLATVKHGETPADDTFSSIE